MAAARSNLIGRLAGATGRMLSRLDVLALFPLTALVAVWFDLTDLLTVTAFALPALLAFRSLGLALGTGAMIQPSDSLTRRPRHGMLGRDGLLATLDRVAQLPDHDSICLVLQIDDWDRLAGRWGTDAAENVMARCGERICATLRQGDVVARLGDARFGVVLRATPMLQPLARDDIATRLHAALADPIAVGNTTLKLGASIGHCPLLRETSDAGAATLAAAELALTEAYRGGPNTVRAYSPGLLQHRMAQADLACEVDAALENGQIRPWFQPQVCTASGVISGFEALARWHHPRQGVLAPGTFLPAIEDAGRMEQLGHAILRHALDALFVWDAAGLRVPSVSVNFSAGELRTSTLADHIKWELDRFDLRPGRLTVEILETVAANGADDPVMATIASLRAHGVNMDLDDFGIGQASLAAIRRFGVNRIKIDRSFVVGLDTDPEQQAMVAAILSMARHLGVETLAEGVETHQIQAMLAQMGCDHVQGFHIARPMPIDETIDWARRHNATITQLPGIGRRAG